MTTYTLYLRSGKTKADAAYYINEQGNMVSFIFDPANTDYQAYLKYVEDGGEVLPAPEPEPVPELTPAEKLAASGLTVDELKQLLGLS